MYFFHDKAKSISWSSVKARTAWMNFAFLPNLKISDPDTVSDIFLSLIPGNVRVALGQRSLHRQHLMSLPQVDTDKKSQMNKEIEAKVKMKRQPRWKRKGPEKRRVKVVYLLLGEDETEDHRNDAVYPGPSTLNGDNRMGEHSEIMSAPAKLARAGGKCRGVLFCHRFINSRTGGGQSKPSTTALRLSSTLAASTPSTILSKESRKLYGNLRIERRTSSTSGIC